ncbi:MAG: hypothetical protein GXP53_09825 [Deltaproteobacteria bacterium]|nr:hypothetical protein [Deltaproteobacteria bacterium]
MPQGAQKAAQAPSPTVHSPRLSGDIHISADKLISSRDAFTAEFSGNVLATQAGATIQSDQLFVYYEKRESSPSDEEKGGMGANRIKKIVAMGNVKIKMNNKTAFCDKAVYAVADGIIVLTGNDVRIADAGNYIHGRQITLNRLTGAISVSGGPEKRVEAVFNPGAENTPVILKPENQD